METIIFKSYYFNKSLYWLLGIGAFLSPLIFLEVELPVEYKCEITMSFLSIGAIFITYLSRYEPHYIKFDVNEFNIVYFNKLIFKKPSTAYLRHDIKCLSENGNLILFSESGKQAIIRKKDLEKGDWDVLTTYFLSSESLTPASNN
jgi:hypothetical protein